MNVNRSYVIGSSGAMLFPVHKYKSLSDAEIVCKIEENLSMKLRDSSGEELNPVYVRATILSYMANGDDQSWSLITTAGDTQALARELYRRLRKNQVSNLVALKKKSGTK